MAKKSVELLRGSAHAQFTGKQNNYKQEKKQTNKQKIGRETNIICVVLPTSAAELFSFAHD